MTKRKRIAFTLAIAALTFNAIGACGGSIKDRTLTEQKALAGASGAAGTMAGTNAGRGAGGRSSAGGHSGAGGAAERSGTGGTSGDAGADSSGGAGASGAQAGEDNGGSGAGAAGTPTQPTGCEPGVSSPCSVLVPKPLGNCAAGHVTCGKDGHYGSCDVSPALADSCTIVGDDADCDGTPNGGCTCLIGDKQHCGPKVERGICRFGESACVSGAWGMCQGAVTAEARNCQSPDDNDCDGTPDDTIDASCQCKPGTSQACGAHAGFDGKGQCKAGTQPCVLASDGSSSHWGDCVGSVGPAAAETCDNNNVDENCNGQVNENPPCACLNGQTQGCGNCSGGTQTCVNGAWGSCTNQPAAPVTYYRDADGDHYGNPSQSTTSCTGAPSGYVTDKTDCCDSDARANPGFNTAASMPDTPRKGCGGWDFNCDNQEIPYLRTLSGCPSNIEQPGWVGTPPVCGATGPYEYDYCTSTTLNMLESCY